MNYTLCSSALHVVEKKSISIYTLSVTVSSFQSHTSRADLLSEDADGSSARMRIQLLHEGLSLRMPTNSAQNHHHGLIYFINEEATGERCVIDIIFK